MIKTLISDLEKVGLRVNHTKCKILCDNDIKTRDELCKEFEFENAESTMEILGSQLDGGIAALLKDSDPKTKCNKPTPQRKRLEAARSKQKMLLNCLQCQAATPIWEFAWHTLRTSIAATLDYDFQLLGYDACKQEADELQVLIDEVILELGEMCTRDLTKEMRSELGMSTKWGGAALRCARIRARILCTTAVIREHYRNDWACNMTNAW